MTNPFKIMGTAFAQTLGAAQKVANNPLEAFNPNTWIEPMVETARVGSQFEDTSDQTRATAESRFQAKGLVDGLAARIPLSASAQSNLQGRLARQPRARGVIAQLLSAEGAGSAQDLVLQRYTQGLLQGRKSSLFDLTFSGFFQALFSLSAPTGKPRPATNLQATVDALPKQGRARIDRYLSRRSPVFVGGFGGESFKDNYFKVNRDVLSALGSSSGRLQPSSMDPVSQTADQLPMDWIERFHEGGQKPLVVFAHSKGAAETLLALAKAPELLEAGIVKEVVLIQGALQGSPIADGLMGLMSMPMNMMLPPSMVGNAAMAPAVRSLKPSGARSTMRDALDKLQPSQREALSQAVRYVRSAGGSMGGVMGDTLAATMSGAHDGMIPYEAQRVPGLGQDLKLDYRVEPNHLDLILDDPSSRLSTQDKHQITLSMLDQLAQEAS